MPVMSVQRVRDGGNKIVFLARALVNVTQVFAPYLIQKYGATSAIGILVSSILALGEQLPLAAADVVEFGGGNDAIQSDPSEVSGITPDAPLPPALPE